jgi:hypothetical protein
MEQGGRIPHENAQVPASASPGRGEPVLAWPSRHPGRGEQLHSHRAGEAESDQGLDEPSTPEASAPHVVDQLT